MPLHRLSRECVPQESERCYRSVAGSADLLSHPRLVEYNEDGEGRWIRGRDQWILGSYLEIIISSWLRYYPRIRHLLRGAEWGTDKQTLVYPPANIVPRELRHIILLQYSVVRVQRQWLYIVVLTRDGPNTVCTSKTFANGKVKFAGEFTVSTL